MGFIYAGIEGQGLARLDGRDARQLPASEGVAGEGVHPGECRQLPDVRSHKNVPVIVVRRSFIVALEVGEIERQRVVAASGKRGRVGVERQVVGALRPGVIRRNRKSVGEGPQNAELAGGVPGIARLAYLKNVGEVLIGPAGIGGERASWDIDRRVLIDRRGQVVSPGAYVSDPG